MKTSLRAYLFGTFEIFQNQTAISLPGSSSARSLLAFLCLNRQQPIPRSVLAGTFWPEQTESLARRALSQALWHIRRSIPNIMTTETQTVQISPEAQLWVDANEFQALVTSIKPATHQNPKSTIELQQAAQLYRGDLLSGFYDEWVFIERESLRAQYLRILESLIQTKKSMGQFTEAQDYARQFIQSDPLNEEIYRLLMQINLAIGRPQAALQVFKECQQILDTELGVEPEDETLELAKEIERQSSHTQLPYLPPSSKSQVPLIAQESTQYPLIGREPDRIALLTSIEGIFKNQGGVTLIEGNAGIGKTRLLQEITRDAEWRGAQALWGGCREAEGVGPFHALVEAIRSGLSHLRVNQLSQLVDNVWLQTLQELIPELIKPDSGITPLSQLAPHQARARLQTAFAQLLIAWSQINPILLVLEDIHWANNDLLEILIDLATHFRNQRIAMLISYRGEDAREHPELWAEIQNLDRIGARSRLLLHGLNANGSGELVRRLLGLPNPAPLFEERLHAETSGNPLFLLETLRALLEENILTQDANGDWHTPWDETTTNYGEIPMPQAVENVITRRLKNLDPQIEALLQKSAVLGDHFNFSLLQASSGMEITQLLTLLSELIHRRFLLETEAEYIFSHAQVRKAIYAQIPAPKRYKYHHQIGKILEKKAPDQLARLAYHFYQAKEWEKNLKFSQLAGDQAAENYANHEALAHYSRALELLPVDQVNKRYAVLLAREKIYDLLGEREAQAQELELLATLAQQMQSTIDQIEVTLRQAHQAEAVGDYKNAIKMAQTAASLAHQTKEFDLEGKAYLESGRALWRQGSYDAAREQLGHTLRLARENSLCSLEAEALNNLGNVCLYQGEYSQAKKYYEQTLPLHRKLGNRQGEGNVTYNLGYVIHDMGDVETASKRYLQALEIYQEIGFQRGIASAHNIYGITQQDLGDITQARENFEQAEKIFAEIDDQQSRAQAIANIGVVWMNLGLYAKAQPYFEQGLHIQRDLGDQRGEGAMLSSLSAYFNYQKEYTSAKQFANQAMIIFDELGDLFHQGFTLTYLGNAHFGLGELEAAAQAYQQAFEVRQMSEQANRAVGSLGNLAQVALAKADFEQALDYAEQILQYLENGTLDGCDDPIQIYLTCYRVLKVGEDPRAIEILKTGHAQLQERAARIGDEEMRRSFLENISYHRELVATYREWQNEQNRHQVQVRLPKIGAPTGRPLREDEWVEVYWTPQKPGDKEISNKREQRQHRLRRLLEEAEVQGGAPTLEDLSEALAVSIPTIKRDLAALRQAGHSVQTRGSRAT